MWDLSSPTRDQTCVLCIGRQILNYWVTREVPTDFKIKGYTLKNLVFFIYVWLHWVSFAARRAFSSCSEQASHCSGFSLQSMGSRVQGQWLWGMGLVVPWPVESSRPGIKPVSPALAGGFPTTGPPWKSCIFCIFLDIQLLHTIDYISCTT